mgnify:CR=1 FL=1
MPPAPETERLTTRHAPAPVAAPGAVFDLLKRPSSDLQRNENPNGDDTDYRHTRRPTNTRSSIVPTLVALLLSFLTNFIILHGALDYDTLALHTSRVGSDFY